MDDNQAPIPHEGSSLYYSLLELSTAARQQWLQRLSLCMAIGDSLHDVQEPDVAEKKVQWWHQEIIRLFEQQAQHPLSIPCQSTLAGNELAKAWLLDILDSAAVERFGPAATDAELETRLGKDYTARFAVVSDTLGQRVQDLQDPLDHRGFQQNSMHSVARIGRGNGTS